MLRLCGAIAQLGERYTGSVEVGGSIPPSSTKFHAQHLKVLSPSSSRPRTPPFHGGNRGSNPLGDAIHINARRMRAFLWMKFPSQDENLGSIRARRRRATDVAAKRQRPQGEGLKARVNPLGDAIHKNARRMRAFL